MARLLRSRSALVAFVAALAIVGAVALTAAGASTRPDLPSVPADRLIASAIAAAGDRSLSLSGTVETHVDLGLPQLPATLGPTSPLGALLADQTIKVWRSPDGVRVAQVLPAAERDVYASTTDVWLWDSDRFTAWHASVPESIRDSAGTASAPTTADLETTVSAVLKRIEPYANVTTAEPVDVSGRAAYEVRLTPAGASDTLVDHVDVAIDAQTRVPLRLEISAKGSSTPVVRAAYTSISFAPVDPSVLRFTPPPGATVRQLRAPSGDEYSPDAGAPRVRWFGTGFDLIGAVRVPSVPRELAGLFPYRGPIASADVVDRGDHAWVVAGLVPPEALARVEPDLT